MVHWVVIEISCLHLYDDNFKMRIEIFYPIFSYFVSVKQKMFPQAREDNLEARQETGNNSW